MQVSTLSSIMHAATDDCTARYETFSDGYLFHLVTIATMALMCFLRLYRLTGVRRQL